jgi:hypothetical protein
MSRPDLSDRKAFRIVTQLQLSPSGISLLFSHNTTFTDFKAIKMFDKGMNIKTTEQA